VSGLHVRRMDDVQEAVGEWATHVIATSMLCIVHEYSTEIKLGERGREERGF